MQRDALQGCGGAGERGILAIGQIAIEGIIASGSKDRNPAAARADICGRKPARLDFMQGEQINVGGGAMPAIFERADIDPPIGEKRGQFGQICAAQAGNGQPRCKVTAGLG